MASIGTYAQDVVYTYDAAGNRTARQYIVSTNLVEDAEVIASIRSQVIQEDAESPIMLDPSLVQIYPNPASDFIQVDLRQEGTDSKLYLFDMTGRSLDIQIMSGSTGRMDMSRYQQGSYILMIQTGTSTITRKIIKQ